MRPRKPVRDTAGPRASDQIVARARNINVWAPPSHEYSQSRDSIVAITIVTATEAQS